MKRLCLTAVVTCLLLGVLSPAHAQPQPIKVMIIGGQNNHDWKQSTPFMKQLLDKGGHFETVINNAPEKDAPASEWEQWQPQFKDYACVILDYNGQMWPDQVKKDFLDYIHGGGGAIAIHAANNSFGGWKEFERMIGLLWRSPNSGSSLYVDEDGKVVRVAPGTGRGMGHGSTYDWVMTTRDTTNPITQGMPVNWMHKKDELYHGQRGPAEDIHILLTAYSDPAPGRGGTGKHEPMVWWVPSGKGKVVTNLLGHVGNLETMQCVGFKILLYRSVEWLANGTCTTPIPENFPTAEKTVIEE